MSARAAKIVAAEIKKNPSIVLCLPTGSTPLGMYKELVRMHRDGAISFKKVVTFNLDEYVGLEPSHPQSYHFFMWDSFFSHIDIQRKNVHILDGQVKNIAKECENYEKAIQKAGGLDLTILGIGRDGHIAFNEPGSSLGSRTRIKTLDSVTIQDNARFFDRVEDVPTFALTMGIGTIMESRSIIILAEGQNKAQAVADFVEGPVTAMVTASQLQLHPKVTAILDDQAASKIQRVDYYRQVESMWEEKLDV